MCRRPRAQNTSARRGAGRNPKRAGGFALIAALAVLVLLGGIGAAMLRASAFGQAGSSDRLIGLRADRAASSGLEWGRRAATMAGGCPAPSTTFALTEGALGGFRVVVGCSETRHDEDGTERVALHFSAQAIFGTPGQRDFAFRAIEAIETL